MSATTSYKSGTAESSVEFLGLGGDPDRSAEIKSYLLKNKRYPLVGAGLVALLLLLFVVSRPGDRPDELSRGGQRCFLSNKRPASNNWKMLTSDDRKSIASFRGYLEFFHRDPANIKEREKYQSLELQSVDWVEYLATEPDYGCSSSNYNCVLNVGNKAIKSRRMKLKLDCASIELVVQENNGKWLFTAGKIVYDAGIYGTDLDERLLDVCSIETTGQLDFEAHHHYKCNQNQSLDCSVHAGYVNKDRVYTRLWIEEFEFELNGDADLIKDSQFSKPVTMCNVSKFKGESRK